MYSLLVAATFLALVVGSNSGHAIAKLEDKKNASDITSQDVYEVNDKSSPISFTYPHQKEQTLREIVYYHVIERPYKDSNAPSAEGLDFDETLRPFTNSHGYQFLDPDLDREKQKTEQSAEEASLNEDREFVDEANNNATTPTPEYEIVYVDEVDGENGDASTTLPEQQTYYVIVPDKQSKEVEAKELEIGEVTTVETVTEKPLENKVKHTRKLLFDLVKEKYYDKSNEQNITSTTPPQERRKREIGQIPEAPRLGELNLDSLPPYLRTMIAAGKSEQKDKTDEDLEVIEHKVRGLFEELKTADDEEDTETHAPKTYGMNLTGDGGYIWNDMWSDPGIYYNVEQSHAELTMEAEQESIEENMESEDDDEDEDDDDIEVPIKKEDRHKRPSTRMRSDDVADDTSLPDRVPIEGRGRKHNKHNREPNDDVMEELIENDQFWKWLADWTSVYMEALSENIKEKVKEEVARQSQTSTASTIDKETLKPDSNDNQNQKDSAKKTQDSEHNHSGSQDSVTENTEPEIKDSKLLTDGKEIPIVHSLETNVDELKVEDSLKKRKDKDDKKPIADDKDTSLSTNKDNKENTTESIDKKQFPVDIKAKNLFGSTIGSEKVTNIFIFYPYKDNEHIIDDLQAANLTEASTYVIGKPSDTDDIKVDVRNKDIEDKNEHTETTTLPAVKESSTESLIDKKDNNKAIGTTIATTKPPNDNSTKKETLVSGDIVPKDEKPTSTTERIVESGTESKEVKSESTRDNISDEDNRPAEEIKNDQELGIDKKEVPSNEKVETNITEVSTTERNVEKNTELKEVKNESTRDVVSEDEKSPAEEIKNDQELGTEKRKDVSLIEKVDTTDVPKKNSTEKLD